MTPKQKVEAFIVLSAWTVYLALVITRIANVEGFVVLSTYIVKKFLDMLEVNDGGSNGKVSTKVPVTDISGGKPVNI